MKLPNSSSDYSVYSTNGEQLTGDLAGYNELAVQFDKKRIVFYFEASDKAILLGTRLIVQIIGGREERAIFIRRYAAAEFSTRGDFINRFYDDARTRVENLQQIKYRVLSLLKEGDLPVRERSVTIPTISAIIGKILIRKPVKIRIEDLSLSFGATRKIIESCNQINIPGYKIAIAQYPFDADILISPNITGMDLEVLFDGQVRVQPVFEKDRLLFQAISELYDKQRNTLKSLDFQDKDKFSRTLKNNLIDSDIINDMIRKNPREIQDILDLYEGDTASLYQILKKNFVYNKTLYGVSQKVIALVVDHIIGSVKSPGPEDSEILKIGYIEGNDDLKNTIQQYLVSHGRFEDYFLKDLFTTSIKTCNLQLLKSVVTNRAFNDQKLRSLNNSIAVHDFEQTDVLNFIESIFKSDFDKETKGHPVYLAVVRQYQDQQFNTKKLNQLQDQYGRTRIPSPQPTTGTSVGGNTKKIAIIILVALIAVIGIIVISFIGIPGPGVSGDKTQAQPTTTQMVNQTSTETINETTTQAVNQTIPLATNETTNQTIPLIINQTINQTIPVKTTQTRVIENVSNSSA